MRSNDSKNETTHDDMRKLNGRLLAWMTLAVSCLPAWVAPNQHFFHKFFFTEFFFYYISSYCICDTCFYVCVLSNRQQMRNHRSFFSFHLGTMACLWVNQKLLSICSSLAAMGIEFASNATQSLFSHLWYMAEIEEEIKRFHMEFMFNNKCAKLSKWDSHSRFMVHIPHHINVYILFISFSSCALHCIIHTTQRPL